MNTSNLELEDVLGDLKLEFFKDLYPLAPTDGVKHASFLLMMDKIAIDEMVKGYRMAIRKKSTHYWEQLLDKGSIDELVPAFVKLREYTKNQVADKFYPWQFLTINPAPLKTFDECVKKVKKFVSKSFIKNYIWVIEQRGDNQEQLGDGFHFHIILEHECRDRSQYKVAIKSSFEKICDVSNPRILNSKPIIDEAAFGDRFRYINGNKKGEEKLLKTPYDKIFREKNNLENIYISDNFKFMNLQDIYSVLVCDISEDSS